mgnify:CR=1 FL=1
MNASTSKRKHDGLTIPEGFFFEVYTPAAGPIVSPGLGIALEYAKVQLSADANLTFVNLAGQTVTAFPLAKGSHPFLVREIIAVSTGSVAILHDGVPKTTTKDFTGPIYQ